MTYAALGDTILILDADRRVGYFLQTDLFLYPVFLTLKFEQFEVELNRIRTTIKHYGEMNQWNDWFVFRHDDEDLAAIGNVEVKSFGNVTYHIYIKNNVTPEFQHDLFFFYVAARSLSRIRGEIGHLQKKN